MNLPFSNLQVKIQNPDASAPLILPVHVVCNTDEEIIRENIRINAHRPGLWLRAQPACDADAILCGSGPSLKDSLREIEGRVRATGVPPLLIALNGAARFLADNGLMPDVQIILDAQEATADLIGPAKRHLFASQVHPKCFEIVPNAELWHLQIEGIDDLLPPYEADYTLIGAASSVGVTALVIAYALGHRTLHCYGYDSSARDGETHARHQAMNDGEPMCSVAFNGKDYRTSLTMKMQAERFPYIARLLQREGCAVHVHGSGLLPDIWNAPVEELSEREKYQRLWSMPAYREIAPGEDEVDRFLHVVEPGLNETVVDFGCGTGRASLALYKAGLRLILVDFTSNCRDPEATGFTFIEHDLSQPLPIRAPYGFCTDVMEHIPVEQTRAVLKNMFEVAPSIYFAIDTKLDCCGMMINQTLHVALLSHGEWRALLSEFGEVAFEKDEGDRSIFHVKRGAH